MPGAPTERGAVLMQKREREVETRPWCLAGETETETGSGNTAKKAEGRRVNTAEITMLPCCTPAGCSIDSFTKESRPVRWEFAHAQELIYNQKSSSRLVIILMTIAMSSSWRKLQSQIHLVQRNFKQWTYCFFAFHSSYWKLKGFGIIRLICVRSEKVQYDKHAPSPISPKNTALDVYVLKAPRNCLVLEIWKPHVENSELELEKVLANCEPNQFAVVALERVSRVPG
jgi:hypothetical protein